MKEPWRLTITDVVIVMRQESESAFVLQKVLVYEHTTQLSADTFGQLLVNQSRRCLAFRGPEVHQNASRIVQWLSLWRLDAAESLRDYSQIPRSICLGRGPSLILVVS